MRQLPVYIIENKTQCTSIAIRAGKANTAVSRMIGLLNRQSLDEGEALIITQCNSIHMFFMRFAIDCIFVDVNNCIVGLVKNIKPWRLSNIYFKAKFVIETPIGVIEKTKSSLGDNLCINSAE